MTDRRVALYFVASPLQYLAARCIAEQHEHGARQVLVWYKRGVASIVRDAEWDAAAYMPWPRFEPLPGPFGRLRQLARNIDAVAALAGPCETLHIHSAVFDTEAVNYFLRALPARLGAHTMHARILPDGIISTRRYPLDLFKRLAQYLRKLRRLAVPELDYWCFGGDRIGSDAPFCDRIYVLEGLPHEYPAARVIEIAPLVRQTGAPQQAGPARALVIGQPLVASGLMRAVDREAVSTRIRDWIAAQGIAEVAYKPHPKDPNRELCEPGYRVLEIDEPLETYMSRSPFAIVAGVRSSALLFARQIYGPQTRVAAFGWPKVRFKAAAERDAMQRAFVQCGIELHD